MMFGNIVTGERLAPVHPGEILLQDSIEPMGLTRHKVDQEAMPANERPPHY